MKTKTGIPTTGEALDINKIQVMNSNNYYYFNLEV